MHADGFASERANCGEALVFAFEEEIIVDSITTHLGNELSHIVLQELEVSRDSVGYIRGEDAAGVKVVFQFHYSNAVLKEVEVYRGRAGGEYGVLTQISV